jgi:hypothetical protein
MGLEIFSYLQKYGKIYVKGGKGNQLSDFSVGQCQRIFQINKG